MCRRYHSLGKSRHRSFCSNPKIPRETGIISLVSRLAAQLLLSTGITTYILLQSDMPDSNRRLFVFFRNEGKPALQEKCLYLMIEWDTLCSQFTKSRRWPQKWLLRRPVMDVAECRRGQHPNRVWATFGNIGLSPSAVAVSRPTRLTLGVFTFSWTLSLVPFNCPPRYLSTIGHVQVFSLRYSVPPDLGCVAKQPDSRNEGCLHRMGLALAAGSGGLSRELWTAREENEWFPSAYALHVPKRDSVLGFFRFIQRY